MAAPLSYTIWFSQRVGSTWLCDALHATNIAGRPSELLHAAQPGRLIALYGVSDARDLVRVLHARGSTTNGVFGIKQGFYQPQFNQVIALLREATGGGNRSSIAVWECAFPNHRHIFLTRRNKVRLAVSWWRAIQTATWHRHQGDAPSGVALEEMYDFTAIDQLLSESVLREAGIADLFAEGNIQPLTVVYEDLIADPRAELERIFVFLGLSAERDLAFRSTLERLADPVSEAWVQRFREDKQNGWQNKGW